MIWQVFQILFFFVKYEKSGKLELQNKSHRKRRWSRSFGRTSPQLGHTVVSKFRFKCALSVGGAVLTYYNKSVQVLFVSIGK